MQKSQLGLMQGLLYQIVYESEGIDLQAAAADRKTEDEFAWRRPWTKKELSTALNSLVLNLPAKRRFCLFVNGLDEYELDNPEEGNYDDLVKYLNTLAASPCVKLCVSSRPWKVFKDSYAELGSFRISMQGLNANDMAVFVRRRLAEHPGFGSILERNEAATKLVKTIQETAKGVFLWVALAVKDLRRGLSERDDFETLQRRVELLPKELDVFLERIFRSIEPVHEMHAARFLLMALHQDDHYHCTILEYSFIRELIADPESAVLAQSRQISHADRKRRTEDAEQLIAKCCKDLLEVAHRDPFPGLHLVSDSQSGSERESRLKSGSGSEHESESSSTHTDSSVCGNFVSVGSSTVNFPTA